MVAIDAHWQLCIFRRVSIDIQLVIDTCIINSLQTIIPFCLVLSAMADSEGRIIEEIHLDDDNEVECIEDLMTLDENEMMDASSQDDIVDITPPPEV